MLTDKAIAEAMRKAREGGGFTLEDFAARLRINRIGTISGWETADNEGEPARGMKIVHYMAELLRAGPETRDRLLRELGAVEQTVDEEPNAEVQRRAALLQRAYESDSPTIRSIVQALEVALMEAAGDPPGRVERLPLAAEAREKYGGA